MDIRQRLEPESAESLISSHLIKLFSSSQISTAIPLAYAEQLSSYILTTMKDQIYPVDSSHMSREELDVFYSRLRSLLVILHHAYNACEKGIETFQVFYIQLYIQINECILDFFRYHDTKFISSNHDSNPVTFFVRII